MDQRPSSGANSHLFSQEIPPPFMETEGSLPYSQEPATGSHPESDASTLQLPTPFPCDQV
jgi:hypothetical protein